MFPITARRRAGTLALAAVALAAGVSPASAFVHPTFERADYETPGDLPRALALGRLDADDRADVLVANLMSGDASLFGNTGGASIALARTLPLSPSSFPNALELGDVDGDGDLDGVVTEAGVASVSVLRNDGAGDLVLDATTAVGGPGVQGLAVGDIDGDGVADVVATHHEVLGDNVNGGFKVLLGRTDGTFQDLGRTALPSAIRGATLADVDGDGDADLLTAERRRVGATWDGAEDGVVVRLGDGAGGFDAGTMHSTDVAQLGVEPAYGDFDGDGLADIVVSSANGNRVTTWPGLGGASFGAPRTETIATATTAFASGDLNDDGLLDVAVAGDGEANAYLGFAGTGARPSVSLENDQLRRPRAIAIGDLDGDGDEDVVTGGSLESGVLGLDRVTVHRNTVAAPPPPPPAKQCEDGKDNDGDGKVDLADAGCSSATDDDESDDPPPPPPALPFEGFFAPVNNLPTVNVVTGGRSIPVKFSLDGDRGLAIFAAGYPRSQEVGCDSTSEVDGIEETVGPGASALTYDAAADRYQYVWKTSEAWAGTCRQLVVKLVDGSTHRAAFRFR